MDVPSELAELRQWCLWRHESGRKVPYQPNGQRAKSNAPATWSTLRECQAVVDQFSGLGFVFSADDPYCGLDLDGCYRDGELAPWAAEILERLPAGYAEISPSGRGIKVWVRGRLPDGKGRKVQVADGQQIEIYDRGRYFAFTGGALDTNQNTIGDCQDSLDAILARFWPAPVASHWPPSGVPFPDGDVPARAAKYLESVPPAVSGQDGHGQTIRVAAILVRGFGLSQETALQVLQPWNARCQPPWSEKELRHKLADADKHDGERGWLLNGSGGSGSDVELGRLLASLQQPETVERHGVPSSPHRFPSECLCPPGLLGEIVRYNLRTALFPQPELALAGALALLGTITGRKVQDHRRTRTNVYCLGLAASGSGKEHARSVNKEILARAGDNGRKMIGPEGIASSAGMVAFVQSQPAILFQLDEIGRLLETMRDPRRAPHLYKIGTMLMQLEANSHCLWVGDAYANQKQTPTINQPHACLYGTSVPRGFWESLTEENVSEGLLGRMLVFEAGQRYVPIATPESSAPGAEIMDPVRWWCDFQPGGNLTGESQGNPQPIQAAYTPDAAKRIDGHFAEICRRREGEDDTRAALWSRTTGKTAKLALLFACSREVVGPLIAITLDDVNRAIMVSNWLTRRMLYQAYRHVARNEREGNHKRILRMLTTRMSKSELSRKTQWLSRREREEILGELIETGEVEMVVEKTATKPLTYLRTIV
jgi:hypothetical protein